MYWTRGAGGSRLERSGGPPAGIASGSCRMFIAFVVVTLVNILFNAIESVANFMGAAWVKKNSHAVGVPDSWLPFLGAVKGAAAVGLAVGLFWRPSGIAAAIGLVVFFALATALHVRHRVFHNFAGPLLFLGLSVAVLWLMVVA